MNNSSDTQKNKPKFLSRAFLEPLTAGMILGGIVMLMQPFFLVLYSYSFIVILIGTIGFAIATKLKD
jgi:predicted lipid-binding transport protein (Tim44 family)